MSEILDTRLIWENENGTKLSAPATIEFNENRIWFLKSPFALKDEIKAMRGSHWHGRDDDPHEDYRKIWSVEDCQRNRFQLGFLQGEDVYAWFDQEIVRHQYDRPLMPHQCDLADSGLTFHYQIWAAEMGTGKTLAAQTVIERSGKREWWWVGPKTSIPNIQLEFKKWGFNPSASNVTWLTYEALVRIADEWKPGDPIPDGLILDESSRCKGATTQRTRAAQRIADLIREKHGHEGYVILMSGTPSPKSPVDWWAQCEIAWPGFLREGDPRALERRLAFMVDAEFDSGVFKKRVGWKDDEQKCKHCGEPFDGGPHELEFLEDPSDFHQYDGSFNEVAYLHERLKGLVVVKHKKDCLSLPDKRYRKIYCKPSPSTLRVAQALLDSAPNTITGLTWARELSDGFQYRDVTEGDTKCTHCEDGTIGEWFDPADEERTFRAVDMLDADFVARLEKRQVPCLQCGGTQLVPKVVRVSKEVPCPKDKALRELLDECEETGRIVIFAGFTGSVDRVANICRREKWAVVRCDGRGYQVTTPDGEILTGVQPLEFWADLANNARIAFVAHPESGGMSLTLVQSRMAVFWSNSFKPEYRSQAKDRIHRPGMDLNLGCEIVDLIHLPTDERVLTVVEENRRLELMSLGEFRIDGAEVEIEEIAA